MEQLTHELLAWLAAGNGVLRPRESTAEAEEEFREVVVALRRLRENGLVTYLNGHVSETTSGIFLAVGPVLLTPAGELALKRAYRNGDRPPWPGPLPWRV
jgi:hypothetical protein